MIDQGKNHQRYLDGKDKKDGDHIEYWEREREREREREITEVITERQMKEYNSDMQ